MLKAQGFDKNVILGVVSLIILIALGIVIFQMGGNRNIPPASPTINPSEIPRVSAKAVKDKLDTGSNLVIFDTRSKASYERVHIVGPIPIPLEEITERYAELRDYDEIITYCT